MFSALGRFTYRGRLWVLAATLVLAAAAAVWGGGLFGAVSDGGFEDPGAESTRAAETIERELGHDGVDVVAVFSSDEIRYDNPTFANLIERMRDELPEEQVASATTYLDEGLTDTERGILLAEDGHATYVPITIEGSTKDERMENFQEIKDDISAGPLEVRLGGPLPVEQEISERAESDVVRAELVSLPLLLALLVVIFGGVVAALTPLAVGGLAIVGSLAMLRALTYVTEVSVFAVNVATLLGLGLAIDYGLFIVSRFREEAAAGRPVAEAVARTLSTAGRTVAFSGVTVMISFAGLLFFPQPMLRSIGMGGIAVVLFDMLAALVVLPALLAVVGRRIDALPVFPRMRRRRALSATAALAAGAERVAASGGGWARLAHSVMRRPVLYLVAVAGVLIAFASALASTHVGSTDQRYLPAEADGREASEMLSEEFPAGDVATADIAVTGDLTGDAGERALEDYTGRLEGLDGVLRADVERVGATAAHVSVAYEGEVDAPATQRLVEDLRAEPGPDGADEVLVGGVAAQQKDTLDGILNAVPVTLGFVIAVTLVLLFMAFGSLVLPVKAVLMGFLSLGASLGVVIWGFQEGHLAALLGFDAVGTIDPTYLVLILVVSFGLAMDYELFLLSRVREEYLHSGDNAHSVAVGLQRTGRIITSAALLLVVVLAAMGTSALLSLKIIGIGLAVAVVVDATLVRALLVPATMRLLGDVNWWLPRPLRWLHDRIGISEGGEEDGDAGAVGPESGHKAPQEA
ncbi:MMPL family transporter [Nocardiopsis sp. RSe5-2]|uniref:MMPL family transporter n=1 Tax=Nocardiopsis endophytica TaxID=3018445 RepID=A0ABT4UEJ8_9ACTN|nr:MMPL family transporter [Nocardiopsis endophytica]MDA2814790.1 MMPL family transporter [Nocardiopsis endophytica]